jgi:nucleoside phosphorylase
VVHLDPSGPIVSRLGRLKNSSDFIELANTAGIGFDLALSERDNYSNSTRIREYLVRLRTALGALSEDTRLASLSVLARELINRGIMEEGALTLELKQIGWRFEDGRLESAAVRAPLADAATQAVPGIRTAVVLTALPLEAEAVIEHLDDACEEEHQRGTVYTVGSLIDGAAAWRVAVVTAGMGNVATALEVERAISQFRPEIVLLVGVAGGLKDVKLGDVVAADKVYAFEKGKAGEIFAPRPESWPGGYRAVQRARQEARKGNWRKRIKGSVTKPEPAAFVKPIAAGEKVIASERADAYELIRRSYGDAIAVEMEGAGLLLATHANSGVDALVIRGISDLVVDKSVTDAAGWQQQAARNAAAFAAEVLIQYRPDSAAVAATENISVPSTNNIAAGRRSKSKYDPDSSTPFFHGRMCDAFPGCEGVCLERDPKASVERLKVLLEPPLGDDINSPVWEVGFGTAAIHSLKTESDDIVHLDHHRYCVRQLVGYRSPTYLRAFVLLYWRADTPTGLYPARSAEDIAESVQLMGVCREEYGVWGDELITRREYDDGFVFRGGRLLRAPAQLQVRQLADGVTFIVPQLSPITTTVSICSARLC